MFAFVILLFLFFFYFLRAIYEQATSKLRASREQSTSRLRAYARIGMRARAHSCACVCSCEHVTSKLRVSYEQATSSAQAAPVAHPYYEKHRRRRTAKSGGSRGAGFCEAPRCHKSISKCPSWTALPSTSPRGRGETALPTFLQFSRQGFGFRQNIPLLSYIRKLTQKGICGANGTLKSIAPLNCYFGLSILCEILSNVG